VAFDHDLHDYYRRIIALHKASPALRRGDYRTLLADDDRRLFAFARQTTDDAAVCLFNADELIHTVELPVGDGEWREVLTPQRSSKTSEVSDGVIHVAIPPHSGIVFRRAQM